MSDPIVALFVVTYASYLFHLYLQSTLEVHHQFELTYESNQRKIDAFYRWVNQLKI